MNNYFRTNIKIKHEKFWNWVLRESLTNSGIVFPMYELLFIYTFLSLLLYRYGYPVRQTYLSIVLLFYIRESKYRWAYWKILHCSNNIRYLVIIISGRISSRKAIIKLLLPRMERSKGFSEIAFYINPAKDLSICHLW